LKVVIPGALKELPREPVDKIYGGDIFEGNQRRPDSNDVAVFLMELLNLLGFAEADQRDERG